jgi:hypothetical protein
MIIGRIKPVFKPLCGFHRVKVLKIKTTKIIGGFIYEYLGLILNPSPKGKDESVRF